MIETEEQQAITGAAANTKKNILVQALAGSGKSTTLKLVLPRLPQKSVLVTAFNKRIAEEFERTMPRAPKGSVFAVKTFHALGLSVLAQHFPGRCKVNPKATEDIVNRAAGYAISFKMRRAAVRLLRTLKETFAEHATPKDAHVLALGLEYQYFDKLNDTEIGLTVEVVRDAYTLSLDFESRDSIDFCDMVWGPVARDLAPKSRYQCVMVDELQDISQPQLALIRKMLAPGGRFIGVGDLQQQIYGWRGSMGAAAWSKIKEDFQAIELPLTMTWRCSTAIVEAARALVPKLRARPDAPKGVVQDCAWDGLPKAIAGQALVQRDDAKIHTFVLSRNNAMLIDCALFLWRERVRFELNNGKELLDPVFTILDTKLDLRNKGTFYASLRKWRDAELARAEKANATAYADSVEEQAAMLALAANYTEPSGIKRLLTDIINPNDSGVLLSTVHKVKGLEAERVFLLKQTFARYDERKCLACGGSGDDSDAENASSCGRCRGSGIYVKQPEPEELNIEYVAITRAISRLVWVNCRSRSKVLSTLASEHNTDERKNGGNGGLIGEDIRQVLIDEDIRQVLDGEKPDLGAAVRDRQARENLSEITGYAFKTEREQLLEASEMLGGMGRQKAEAMLGGADKHHSMMGDDDQNWDEGEDH